jgi:pyruvate dehydrogenase E2 component (dihydrolipoamide acetyltransferase)
MPKTAVVMPKMSMTMTEGEVVEITVTVGQKVSQGDVVAVVGTDKTDMEVESDFEGEVLEISAGPGDVLEVGAPLLVLETEGEDLLAGMFGDAPEAAVAEPVVEAEPAVTSEPIQAKVANQSFLAMPGARKLASEQGVDLADIVPASPAGIIKQSDIPAAGSRADKARHQVATVVNTAMTIPQFSLSGEIRLVADLAASSEERFAQLARAWVRTLSAHPKLNQQYVDGKIVPVAKVKLAALIKSSLGYVSPVFEVSDVDSETWASQTANSLRAARENQIAADQLNGATTSITDLGEFGIRQANTLIFPPQSSGFNIGATRAQAEGYALDFTIVIDHRIADPGDAAEAIRTFETKLNEVLGGNS